MTENVVSEFDPGGSKTYLKEVLDTNKVDKVDIKNTHVLLKTIQTIHYYIGIFSLVSTCQGWQWWWI